MIRWMAIGVLAATMLAGAGERYAKAGPKPQGYYTWGYYRNPMGPMEYKTFDQMVWMLKRKLEARRPITQAHYDSVVAKVPRNGVFAVRVGIGREGPLKKLSFRASPADSNEIGVCEASTHVRGLTEVSGRVFEKVYVDPKDSPPGTETTFECPMPFAPADSFVVHATTAGGATLFRTRFIRQR